MPNTDCQCDGAHVLQKQDQFRIISREGGLRYYDWQDSNPYRRNHNMKGTEVIKMLRREFIGSSSFVFLGATSLKASALHSEDAPKGVDLAEKLNEAELVMGWCNFLSVNSI
jgi:hypothetical protein